MLENRVEWLEVHMDQLILMVGENNKEIKNLSQNLYLLSEEFKQERMLSEEERKLNKVRHHDLLKELRNNSAEIDYLRNIVSKHDMAIYKFISE